MIDSNSMNDNDLKITMIYLTPFISKVGISCHEFQYERRERDGALMLAGLNDNAWEYSHRVYSIKCDQNG